MASFDPSGFDSGSFSPGSFDLGVGSSASPLTTFASLFWRVTIHNNPQAFGTKISDHYGMSTRITDYVAATVWIPGT